MRRKGKDIEACRRSEILLFCPHNSFYRLKYTAGGFVKKANQAAALLSDSSPFSSAYVSFFSCIYAGPCFVKIFPRLDPFSFTHPQTHPHAKLRDSSSANRCVVVCIWSFLMPFMIRCMRQRRRRRRSKSRRKKKKRLFYLENGPKAKKVFAYCHPYIATDILYFAETSFPHWVIAGAMPLYKVM